MCSTIPVLHFRILVVYGKSFMNFQLDNRYLVNFHGFMKISSKFAFYTLIKKIVHIDF